jgi:hypothetical protein
VQLDGTSFNGVSLGDNADVTYHTSDTVTEQWPEPRGRRTAGPRCGAAHLDTDNTRSGRPRRVRRRTRTIGGDAMAKIRDQLQAEGVVKEARSHMIKGMRASSGLLYLTSRRLVFVKTNAAFGAFGLVGGLLGALIKPSNVTADIPLEDVTGVQRGKFGRNNSILEISQGMGDSFRFSVKGFEEWEQAIQDTKARSVA